MPAVDVVIPTFERPSGLRRCLEALAKQTFADFAGTVVDDASATPTEAAIPLAIRDRLDLTVVRLEENGGPGRARNRGVRQGHAPIICFLDDDIIPAPDLVARHYESVRHEPALVAIGPMVEPPGAASPPWMRWESEGLEEQYRAMEAGEFAPTWRQFYTGNAALSRAAFEAGGGFDERFRRAEDIELAFRLERAGCRFLFDPDARATHQAARSAATWLAIPRAYARMHVALDQLHPESDWLKIVDREGGWRGRFLRRAVSLGPLAGTLAAAATFASLPVANVAGGWVAHQLVGGAYALVYWSELERAQRSGRRMVPGPAITPAPIAAPA